MTNGQTNTEMAEAMVKAKTSNNNAESKTKASDEYVTTKTGVMIVGAELLGRKLLNILGAMIDMNEEDKLSSVIIRDDNYPQQDGEPVFAMTYADTYSICINLQRCWDHACEVSEKGEHKLGFMGVLWIDILCSIGHEMDHIRLASKDRSLYEKYRSTEKGNKALEEVANESAKNDIVKMVKKYNLEIPAANGFGWCGIKLMELFTDEKTKDLDWVIRAQRMIKQGVIYDDGEEGVEIINTFRAFVRMAYQGKHVSETEDSGEQATIPVNLEVKETGEVIKAEPVQEAKIELKEKIEETAVVAQESATPSMFVASGISQNDSGYEEVYESGPGTNMSETKEVTDEFGDSVPLPEAVVQQQAQHASAAATGIPEVSEKPRTYTPNELSSETMKSFVEAMWKRLYHHVFTKCGWMQNPTTGRFYFSNAGAIAEGVDISDLVEYYGAENFIKEYDTVNATGQYAAEEFKGVVRGRPTSAQGLPSYDIYINVDGHRFRRRFVAGNPEKKSTQNAYTKMADYTANGNMVVFVYKSEMDHVQGATFQQKCACKIDNNKYEVFDAPSS